MVDQSARRAELTLEIYQLAQMQNAATENAAYLGWTAETEQTYKKHLQRILELREELRQLGVA